MRSPTSGDAGLFGRRDAVVRCCLNAATRHRTGENKLLPSRYYNAKTTPIADKPCPRNRIPESGQVSRNLETKRFAIKQWKGHVGHLRLDKIRHAHIDSFIAKRQKEGVATRTVNSEV